MAERKEYIVHKAIAPEKVIVARRTTPEFRDAEFIAEAKYDGCCGVMVLPGRGLAQTYSRTGEEWQSMKGVEREILGTYKEQIAHYDGLVLIGEAWRERTGFNIISGECRRGQENDDLKLVIHDILTHAEFWGGESETPYDQRRYRLGAHVNVTGDRHFYAATWAPGTYGSAQALCNTLVSAGGYDGLVQKDPNGGWRKGANGTTGEIIKVKARLSFDLRVLEVKTAIGPKTGRTVYTLVVDYRGKRLGVGSGVPHDEADVPKVGDIVEIEAMMDSSEGLLREPRFKGIRHDKLEPDT